MSEESRDGRAIEAGVETFYKQFQELAERHDLRAPDDLLEKVRDEELAKLQYARLLGVLVAKLEGE